MGQSERIVGADSHRLAWRIFLLQQVNLFTTSPAVVYIMNLVTDVPQTMLLRSVSVAALLMPIFGIGVPYAAVKLATEHAVRVNPDDAPGARLTRILKLPRVLEFLVIAIYMAGVCCYTLWVISELDRSLLLLPWAMGVVALLTLLVLVWTRIFIERILQPLALAEFHRSPNVALQGEGILWPEQRWYLPYTFALFILCTLATTGTIVGRGMYNRYSALVAALEKVSLEEVLPLVKASAAHALREVSLPLMLIGAFMVVTAALSAFQLARHQYRGFRAVQETIEGFAQGSPRLPDWVTTDELGGLSRATARVFDKLKDFSLTLKESATSLGSSAGVLDQANSKQNEMLARQASSLQETQVTAQQIRQTSLLAAQKAEGVLNQADIAEQLGRDGEVAIEQSLNSLQEIRKQVEEMATRITTLDDRARQIRNITDTVKDLADQSNMLALNAAIEAVRSGDHGKGFGVVAREIRGLADQSIQATGHVREILLDIGTAIRTTVEITKQGSEKIEAGFDQVRTFSNSMRKLSAIMKDNSTAVRQISAAVNQQNQGISQIFQAISDLNELMTDTIERVNKTTDATAVVRDVAGKVSDLVKNQGWESINRPAKP